MCHLFFIAKVFLWQEVECLGSQCKVSLRDVVIKEENNFITSKSSSTYISNLNMIEAIILQFMFLTLSRSSLSCGIDSPMMKWCTHPPSCMHQLYCWWLHLWIFPLFVTEAEILKWKKKLKGSKVSSCLKIDISVDKVEY